MIACGLPGHPLELLLALPLIGAGLLVLRGWWHRITCRRRCANHKHKEHPHP